MDTPRKNDSLCPQCSKAECNCQSDWANSINKEVKKVGRSKAAKARKLRIRCNQCEACMINGVFCHETGCPNSGARYDVGSGEWVKQRKCFECGCTVDADDPCCSGE